MPEQLPLVTIVTPSYNQGQFIDATIQSVLAQTYPNIEYIIVDGGSTDDTMRVVGQYADRIHRIISEPDRGQSDAINKGFRLANGELVGWINSDDLLYPDCVARIVELYQQHPDGAIFYGAVNDWIDASGRVIEKRSLPIPNRNFLLAQNYDLIQQGSFYATDLVRRVGYLNEANNYCMDLDLWLRLLAHGPIYRYDKQSIAAFRRWEETKTSTGGQAFLRDIRQTLLRHGASPYARTVWQTRYYAAKLMVKNLLMPV